jgi:hypothetical protein
MGEKIKIKVDILKTKLIFFSAIAGGSWANLSFELKFYDLIMGIVFIYSIIGTLKTLIKLNKIEKDL